MRTVIILLLGSCARTLAEGSRHHSDSAGVTPLVALARNGTDEQKARAAHALWTLAFDNADNIAISQAGGIPALVALARDGTDQQKTYATMALRHLAANAENNASISRAYVRAREKSKTARSGRVIGAEAKGARASAKKEAMVIKAKIAEEAEARAEARAAARAVAGLNQPGFSEILAEAEGKAMPRSAAMPMPRLAAAVVLARVQTGAKAKLAPPKEARVVEEALKRLRASGVMMGQMEVPNLPRDKAHAASSSHLEEEHGQHGLSTEAGTEARTYHYDGGTASDAIEPPAGSEQDDSTGSWKRFYQE